MLDQRPGGRHAREPLLRPSSQGPAGRRRTGGGRRPRSSFAGGARKLLAVAAAVGLAGAAGAIVVRHDRDPADFVVAETRFPALFALYRTGAGHRDCIATLIDLRWAVTAAHCCEEERFLAALEGDGYPVAIGDLEAVVDLVVRHPADPSGRAVDLALLRLAQPVAGVAPMPVYRDRDEAGRTVLLPGWGGTGDGIGGLGAEDGVFRVAENRVEDARDGWLIWQFDDPRSGTGRALAFEGISGPGDSGGPALIVGPQGPAVAGVGSAQRTFGRQEGLYGADEYFVRLSDFVAWIDATIAGRDDPSADAAPAAGQEPPQTDGDAGDGLAARLDAYFSPLAAAGDFGGVVLIGDGERVRTVRSYGKADVGLDVPMAPGHRFRIASLTKTFTGAAMLVLRDRGELRLDDPLTRWLPGFPGGGEITLRHLLRHESGVGDAQVADAPELDLDGLVAAIAEAPRHFAPGAGNRYSNAGYSLLAAVVERASGGPFDDFLRRTFFAPLGMTSTGAAGRWEIVERGVEGYVPGPPPTGLARARRPRPDTAVGSGHLWSTAEDLWRWARAVDAATLFDIDSGDWPYGWGRIRTEGREGIDQTGLTDGFTASLAVHRAADLYVVVLGNVTNADWTRWAADASAIAFGEAPAPGASPPPVPLAPGLPARWAGEYAPVEPGPPPLSVVAREGHLWLQWAYSPPGHYLAPRADGRLEVRGECGTVRFESAGGDDRLVWACGDGATVFRRPSTAAGGMDAAAEPG